MSTNTVSVRLQLIDLASSTLKQFQANIKQLQSQVNSAASGMAANLNKIGLSSKGINSGISSIGNVVKASLLPSLAAATAAAYGLSRGIQQAANTELNNVSTAGAYAALTQSSYAEASKTITALNKDLAQSAAALPGATQDYKNIAGGILDNMVPAFKDASGVIDKSGLLKGVKTLATNFGVLGAQSQTASSDVSKFISKALGGASEASLQQLIFAENNPALLNFYVEELKKQGATIKNSTAQQRAIALELASSKLVTDDVKKAASESFAGVLEGFKSNLFDPDTGLFGLMRDLDGSTPKVESALGSITKGLNAIVGEKGLLKTVGEVLKLFGFKGIDPMLALKNTVDGITRRIEAFQNFLRDMQAMFYRTGGTPVERMRYFSDQVGRWIGNLINSFTQGFDTGGLVRLLSQIWTVIEPGLFAALATIDWFSLTSVVLKAVAAAYAAGAFISVVKSGVVLLATSIHGALVGTAKAFLSKMVASIASFTLALGPVGWLAIGAAAAITLVIVQIVRHWDEIKLLARDAWLRVKDFWRWVTSVFSSVMKLGGSILTGNVQGIFSSIDELISLAGQVVDKFKGFFNFITGKLGDTSNANATASYSLAEQRAIKSGKMTVQQAEANVQQSIGNNVGGNDPIGLLAAAYRERQQAPAGSSLAIANSSEGIYNQGQQRLLASVIGKRGGNNITVSPTFNISGPNPEQIARAVKQELEGMFFQLQSEYLR